MAVKRCSVYILLGVLISSLFFGQSWDIEPQAVLSVDPERLIELAYLNKAHGDHSQAVLIFEQVSQNFPLTKSDAKSRRQRALWLQGSPEKDQQSLALYESMVMDFPETKWGVWAKFNVVEHKFHFEESIPFSEYLAELDNQITSSGGVSIYTPVEATNFQSVTFLTDEDQKNTLEQLYGAVASDIIGLKSGRTEDLLDLATLNARRLRSHFIDEDSRLGSMGLLTRLAQISSGDADAPFPRRNYETSSPTIESTVLPTSSADRAIFKITDGSIEQSQVDLSTLKVQVDDQDEDFFANINIALGDPSQAFEIIQVKVQPNDSWTQGNHMLRICITDFDGNLASANFRFFVADHSRGNLSLGAHADTPR